MNCPLDKTCVTIGPLDPLPCDDCGDSVDNETGALAGAWATKKVMLDLRGNGQTICVGIYCDDCAAEVASRLRDSLPDEQPESIADAILQADAEIVQAILDSPGHGFDPDIHVVKEGEAHKIPEGAATVPYDREAYLAQALKEIFVRYVGNDMTQWPERQEEFRRVAARAAQGELWKLDDWKCKRCDTMNLEVAQSCRKCGKERGERVITHVNTVPGSLMERVMEARTKRSGIWGELWQPTEPENMSLLQREEEQSKADAQHGDSELVGLGHPPCPFCGAPNPVGVKECGACHRKFTPPATKFQE